MVLFWLSEAMKLTVLALTAYLSGLLVQLRSVRVNYTRKINFFVMFLAPPIIDRLVRYRSSFLTGLVHALCFGALLMLFVKPIRQLLPPVATMFLSYDRPEDRPHTLLWLTTQMLAGYLVLLPFSTQLSRIGAAELIFIPILVHGFGDGLAEPIGVRFGRHRYTVRALFTNRRYTRSMEGSACVLVAGLSAVMAFHGSFTSTQFMAAIVSVPILMTLAEALSPHTWDTPLMFTAGGATLIAIKRWL